MQGHRILFCLCLALVLTACASSRSSAPSVQTSFPSYQFRALQGSPVKLTVLDQRAERTDSEALVSRLQESLNNAFRSNGVAVATSAPQELDVRVTQYRSDFELGNWNGCTRLLGQLRQGAGSRQVEADRCVKRSNMYGYRSASEALSGSFRDALAELLSQLDSL